MEVLSGIADLRAGRSECPVPALHVEMCMVQHLSLRGFLAFTVIGTNVRTSLIPPPAPNKSVAIPLPNLPQWKAGRGFGVGAFYASGTLTPSTISRFCASDIPAEYSP